MTPDEITQPTGSNDPLGILGWVIGGKYKVDAYLGGGGFGEVYDGHNVNLPEQRLVIKFFKKVHTRDKFAKEAKILCMLDHPNISRVIDFLQEEGALVVAFIDGNDCGQILKDTGVLGERLFLHVARSVSSAVAYAHERSIAHRDIKPDNIMIDKNEHVYLIDFGIAKRMGGDATRTGYQALTPMFAAPERQHGDTDYNPYLSDVYELGVSLFNFCTNTMPYRNPVNPNLDEWGGPAADKLSPQLKQILKKATHPDPSRRYQKASQLYDELGKLSKVYVSGGRKKTLIVVPIVVALGVAGYFGWKTFLAPPADRAESGAVPVQTQEQLPESPPVISDTPTTVRSGDGQAVGESRPTPPAEEQQTVAAQDTTPTQQQAVIEEEEPAPPPPPPEPVLRVNVVPSESVSLLVDGRPRQAGMYFETSRGTHDLEVVHPNFPVHKSTVRVTEDTSHHAVDLTREYSTTDSVSLQLALIPPSDEVVLDLSLNGAKGLFSSFPVFDLSKLAGDWQVEASVRAINVASLGDLRVDSCVAFPFGRGPRFALTGHRGVMSLKSTGGEGTSVIPFAIYWSVK